MNATAHRPASILRPMALLAACAFAIGFVGVMAATGAGVLAQLGAPSSRTATARAAEVVSSPATSGAVSDEWNFPKKI